MASALEAKEHWDRPEEDELRCADLSSRCIIPVMGLHSLVETSVKFSEATEKRLHLPSEVTAWRSFDTEVGAAMRALPDGALVVDLGGGRHFYYANEVDPPGRLKIIAVDISPEELALNKDVDETYVADVSRHIPLPDASVDLIMSRVLLEHVDGVPAAIREMHRVLRPGGKALHLVPCGNSLFGLGARLLPFGPLLRLTLKLAPWFGNYAFGFKVYYDHCYPNALEREFRAAGFSNVQLELSWACEQFFVGVYPIYLLHAAYEQVVRRLRIRSLAAYIIVRALR